MNAAQKTGPTFSGSLLVSSANPIVYLKHMCALGAVSMSRDFYPTKHWKVKEAHRAMKHIWYNCDCSDIVCSMPTRYFLVLLGLEEQERLEVHSWSLGVDLVLLQHSPQQVSFVAPVFLSSEWPLPRYFSLLFSPYRPTPYLSWSPLSVLVSVCSSRKMRRVRFRGHILSLTPLLPLHRTRHQMDQSTPAWTNKAMHPHLRNWSVWERKAIQNKREWKLKPGTQKTSLNFKPQRPRSPNKIYLQEDLGAGDPVWPSPFFSNWFCPLPPEASTGQHGMNKVLGWYGFRK